MPQLDAQPIQSIDEVLQGIREWKKAIALRCQNTKLPDHCYLSPHDDEQQSPASPAPDPCSFLESPMPSRQQSSRPIQPEDQRVYAEGSQPILDSPSEFCP